MQTSINCVSDEVEFDKKGRARLSYYGYEGAQHVQLTLVGEDNRGPIAASAVLLTRKDMTDLANALLGMAGLLPETPTTNESV